MPVLPTRNVIFALFFLSSLIANSQQLQRVMPGSITTSAGDSIVTAPKIDAAMAIAFETTGTYMYLPVSSRDSILVARKMISASASDAATALGADAVAFTTVSRVHNLIRAELVVASGKQYSKKLSGVGYASITYFNETTKKPVPEPAILNAVQRAIEIVENDPGLYRNADSMLRVIPTELIAVSSVEFPKPTLDLPEWNLFKERTVASYDLLQTVVAELQPQKKYTVVDVETRDSMFAMAGLYLSENYKQVVTEELRILRLFDVHNVILGSFERTAEGALMTLKLCKIENNDTYTTLRTATHLVQNDTRDALHEGTIECVKKLMK